MMIPEQRIYLMSNIGALAMVKFEYTDKLLSALLPKAERPRSQEAVVNFESPQRLVESILGSKTKT